MELCMDLNIRCDGPELDSLVMKFNLMEKVAGKDVRNQLLFILATPRVKWTVRRFLSVISVHEIDSN